SGSGPVHTKLSPAARIVVGSGQKSEHAARAPSELKMCTTSPPSCRKVTEIHPAKSSAKKRMCDPTDTPETATPGKQRLRQQAELVIKRFASLAEVDFDASDRTPTDLSIERLRTKKDLLTEVHSTLLPLLEEQITTIYGALRHHDEVRKDPGPTIRLVLKVQVELGQTLGQTIRAFSEIIPGQLPEPNQTNDQHYREFKTYRLCGLSSLVRGELISRSNYFFSQCKQVIEKLQLPRDPYEIGDVRCSCHALRRSIDGAIAWANGSELTIIRDSWQDGLNKIDEASNDLFWLSIIWGVEKALTAFQTCLLLAEFYIVPLLPRIDVCSFQIEFRTWFVNWNLLFSQATHNVIQACRTYEQARTRILIGSGQKSQQALLPKPRVRDYIHKSCCKSVPIRPAKSSTRRGGPDQKRMSDPEDTREIETPGKQRLRQQAVTKRFASLAQFNFSGSDDTSTELSIEHVRTKKDILTELHSTLLPLFKEQISTISDALRHHDEVRKDPGPTIRLVSKLQPELEKTLDQTIRAINEIIPGQLPEPNQTHDQHFREFKIYRLYGLSSLVRGQLSNQNNYFFSDCKRFIEKLQLPRDNYESDVRCGYHDLHWSIDEAIRWAKGSELSFIHASWQDGLDDINEASKGELDGEISSRLLIHQVEQLLTTFQTCLLLAEFYIAPILPKIDVGSSQIDSRTWFINWNLLFSHAAHNVIQACHAYEQAQSKYFGTRRSWSSSASEVWPTTTFLGLLPLQQICLSPAYVRSKISLRRCTRAFCLSYNSKCLSFHKPYGTQTSYEETPGPTIRLILKLQPDLEQTLDQTIRAINDIIPGTLPKPDQMNDQNFGEFKCYRLRGLNDAIRRGMKTQIIRFFSDCKRFIERLQLPRDGQQTDVEGLIFCSRGIDSRNHELVSPAYLIEQVTDLVAQFQTCLFLADLYIAPLFPQINVSSSPTDFKTWFVVWNTLFSQASHNAIQALLPGLVIKRFGNLANYEFLTSNTTPTDLSIVRLRSTENLLTEVHSTLLPRLQKQIKSIIDALWDPDELWDNTGPTMKLVLKLQAETEETLNQTIRAIDDIIPGKLPKPNQTHDQIFREFKCYRLRGLNGAIRRDMRREINIFFRIANGLLNHFSLDQTTSKLTYYAHVSCANVKGPLLPPRSLPEEKRMVEFGCAARRPFGVGFQAFTGTLRARLVKKWCQQQVVGRSNHGRVASTKTSQKTTELIRTPANDEVGNRQLRYQAIKRFEYLANYDFLDSDSTPTDLSIVRLRPKEHLLTELHSTLLPLLQKQIDSIADALMEPDKVWDNITLVLKLQPELEQTLDQTIRAIDEIIPGKLPEPNPRNDQNSREFKCYRLRGLNQMIRRDMKDYGKNFFLSCKQAIEPLQPPLQPPPNDLQMDLQSAWLDLDWHVEQAISWAKAFKSNSSWAPLE
ncbi:hypothetical protein PSHT_14417, partial [Puccinia striiformis]